MSEEVGEKLLPKFARKAEEMGQHIQAVENGTIEQLHELVRLVASHEVFFGQILLLFVMKKKFFCRLNHRHIQYFHVSRHQKL